MNKKAYIAPTMSVTVIRCQLLVSASGLDGMQEGGKTGGKDADAREGFWMDEEGFDEEE